MDGWTGGRTERERAREDGAGWLVGGRGAAPAGRPRPFMLAGAAKQAWERALAATCCLYLAPSKPLTARSTARRPLCVRRLSGDGHGTSAARRTARPGAHTGYLARRYPAGSAAGALAAPCMRAPQPSGARRAGRCGLVRCAPVSREVAGWRQTGSPASTHGARREWRFAGADVETRSMPARRAPKRGGRAARREAGGGRRAQRSVAMRRAATRRDAMDAMRPWPGVLL